MLQGLVENEGDGWQWTLDELSRYYESVCHAPATADRRSTGLRTPRRTIPEWPANTPRSTRRRCAPRPPHCGDASRSRHSTHNPAFAAEDFTTSDLVPTPIASTHKSPLPSTHSKAGCPSSPRLPSIAQRLILSRRIQLFARARAIASATPLTLASAFVSTATIISARSFVPAETMSSSTSKASPRGA